MQQRRGRALFLIKAGPIALLASYWPKGARIRLLHIPYTVQEGKRATSV